MLKAVILTGGLGTRLKPLTDEMPKCMLPFKGMPFLHFVIADLCRGGMRDFVFACSYQWKNVRGYFQKGLNYKSRFTYSIEDRPRGSANALRMASNRIGYDAPFLVVNGDTLIQGLNAEQLLLAFAKSGKDICKVKAVDPLHNGKYEYAGVAVLSPKVLKDIISSDDNSLEKDYFPKYDVLDYEIDGFFFDIGTKDGMELGKRYLNGEKIELKKQELPEEELEIREDKENSEGEELPKKKLETKDK